MGINQTANLIDVDEDALREQITRALREISATLNNILEEMKDNPEPSPPPEHRKSTRPFYAAFGWLLEKLVDNKFVIYVIGLFAWFVLSIYLPTIVGSPAQSPLEGFRSPLLIGFVLLLLNFLSELFRRGEISKQVSLNKKIYEFERTRTDVIQTYGATVITAASVVAAITSVQTAAVARPLFLAYLGASITVAAVALVPIWVSPVDWRPLSVLRHAKTVMLTWAVAWLAQAIKLLFSA